MKKVILTFALGAVLLGSTNAKAQTFATTYSEGSDHARYSIENLDESVFLGGTIYAPGSLVDTKIHAQKLDVLGGIVWEKKFNLGVEERCVDITLVNDELMVLTGVTKVNSDNRIFVMSLDQANGNLVDYVILNPNSSKHVEQAPSDIIYSQSEDKLFIGGYVFETSTSWPYITYGDGLLFSLDTGLSLNWGKKTLKYVTTIEEIDGAGIYVGSGTNSAVDYSGALIWQIATGNHYNGGATDAEYDVANDRLLILEANGLLEVLSASNSGASLNQTVAYYDVNSPYRNIEHIDIELNPMTDEIMLLQVSEEDMTAYRNYHPCVIRLDNATLNVDGAHVTKTHNPGAYYFDTGYNGYNLNGSMRMSEWGDGFGVAYFEHPELNSGAVNEYDLKVLRTDDSGKSELICEEEIAIGKVAFTPRSQTATTFTNTSYTIAVPTLSNVYSNHEGVSGCFEHEPCGISIDNIQVDYTGCYEQMYSVNAGLNPGTVITGYTWNWGDGSSTTTTSSSTQHTFSNASCVYNVCVTVDAIATDGSTCSDTYCQTIFMYTTDGCEPCGEGFGEGKSGFTNGSNFTGNLELKVSPNPSNDRFVIDITGKELNGRVVVLNSVGQIVFTSDKIEGVSSTTTIDASEFESGIYLLQFQSGDDVISKKIVKM